jgi:hypothetical protein
MLSAAPVESVIGTGAVDNTGAVDGTGRGSKKKWKLFVLLGEPPLVPLHFIHPASFNSFNADIVGRRVRPISFARVPKPGLHFPV